MLSIIFFHALVWIMTIRRENLWLRLPIAGSLRQPQEPDQHAGRAIRRMACPPDRAPLEISSEALLAGRTEILIRHRGETYRLTLTRTGKLILHK